MNMVSIRKKQYKLVFVQWDVPHVSQEEGFALFSDEINKLTGQGWELSGEVQINLGHEYIAQSMMREVIM